MTFFEPQKEWPEDQRCPENGCEHARAYHELPEPDGYIERWMDGGCPDCSMCTAKLPQGWYGCRWKCGQCGEPVDLERMTVRFHRGRCVELATDCCGSTAVHPLSGKDAEDEVIEAAREARDAAYDDHQDRIYCERSGK